MFGNQWDKPTGTVIVRSYKTSERHKMEKDIRDSAKHGWTATPMADQAGHMNVGRTLMKVVATGGLGLLTGASRTKGVTVMRFVRQSS